MRKIEKGRSKPSTGKERTSAVKPGIINKLRPAAKLKKNTDEDKTQTPGIVIKATGMMPEDLERAAREQENHVAAVGGPARRTRAS